MFATRVQRRKKHHSTASFLVKSFLLRFFYCPHSSVCNIAAAPCWREPPPPPLRPPVRLSVLFFFSLELTKKPIQSLSLEPFTAIKQAAVIQGPKPYAMPHRRDSTGWLGFMFLRRAYPCPIILPGSCVVADVILATGRVVKERVLVFFFYIFMWLIHSSMCPHYSCRGG